jgi:hypothetical protein
MATPIDRLPTGIPTAAARPEAEKEKMRLGGQRNPLKRLVSDKGIKGNQSLFLGKIWLDNGWPLIGFEKLGVDFAGPSPGGGDRCPESRFLR